MLLDIRIFGLICLAIVNDADLIGLRLVLDTARFYARIGGANGFDADARCRQIGQACLFGHPVNGAWVNIDPIRVETRMHPVC